MDVFIDCIALQTREDLHRIFPEALGFPAYYGKNLDALYDCLTETAAAVHLQNWTSNGLGRHALALRRVLEDAAACNPRLTVHFE